MEHQSCDNEKLDDDIQTICYDNWFFPVDDPVAQPEKRPQKKSDPCNDGDTFKRLINPDSCKLGNIGAYPKKR